MTSTAIAVRTNEDLSPETPEEGLTFSEQIERAKEALLAATDITDVREIRRIAIAAELYAKAHNLKLEAQEAGKLRLRAERAAGAFRSTLPRFPGSRRGVFDWEEAKTLVDGGMSPREAAERLGVSRTAVSRARQQGYRRRSSGYFGVRQFDQEMGLNNVSASHWQKLGSLPDDVFEETLELIAASDGTFSAQAFLSRLNQARRVVERGISVLPDGRYQISWRKDGTKRSKTLGTRDLPTARKALLRKREGIKPSKQTGKTISDALGLMLSALNALDHADNGQWSPDCRSAVNDAHLALQKAEEHLIRARNAEYAVGSVS